MVKLAEAFESALVERRIRGQRAGLIIYCLAKYHARTEAKKSQNNPVHSNKQGV